MAETRFRDIRRRQRDNFNRTRGCAKRVSNRRPRNENEVVACTLGKCVPRLAITCAKKFTSAQSGARRVQAVYYLPREQIPIECIS